MSALAQKSRLEAFRLLVTWGEEGMPAGKIAENLDIPAATLSFHLKELSNAGLIIQHREGRSTNLPTECRSRESSAWLSYGRMLPGSPGVVPTGLSRRVNATRHPARREKEVASERPPSDLGTWGMNEGIETRIMTLAIIDSQEWKWNIWFVEHVVFQAPTERNSPIINLSLNKRRNTLRRVSLIRLRIQSNQHTSDYDCRLFGPETKE